MTYWILWCKQNPIFSPLGREELSGFVTLFIALGASLYNVRRRATKHGDSRFLMRKTVARSECDHSSADGRTDGQTDKRQLQIVGRLQKGARCLPISTGTIGTRLPSITPSQQARDIDPMLGR